MEIKIEGMHCKSCKSLIEGELGELDCVESVQVSLEDKKGYVVLKENRTDLILKTIKELGFKAKVQ